MEAPAGRPELLREIEHEFSTGKDEEATQRVQLLAFDKLLEWEAEQECFAQPLSASTGGKRALSAPCP